MFIETTQVWEFCNGEQPDRLDVISYQDAMMCDARPVDQDFKSPVPTVLMKVTEVAIIPKAEKQQEIVGNGDCFSFSPTYLRMAKLLKQLHGAGAPQVRAASFSISHYLLAVLLAARHCC